MRLIGFWEVEMTNKIKVFTYEENEESGKIKFKEFTKGLIRGSNFMGSVNLIYKKQMDKETKFNIGDKVFARNTDYVDSCFHLTKGIIEKISLIEDGEGVKTFVCLEIDSGAASNGYDEKYIYKTIEEAMEALKEWSEE